MPPQRKAIVAAIAMAFMLCLPSTLLAAAMPAATSAASDALESMAQQKFGPALTAAERKLLRAAPTRALAWLGPSDDPDNPANDMAQGGHWGPERVVRAEIIAWLVGDAGASRLVHPSGLGFAGARIAGKLDLSYATVDKPMTLVECFVPDRSVVGASRGLRSPALAHRVRRCRRVDHPSRLVVPDGRLWAS